MAALLHLFLEPIFSVFDDAKKSRPKGITDGGNQWSEVSTNIKNDEWLNTYRLADQADCCAILLKMTAPKFSNHQVASYSCTGR